VVRAVNGAGAQANATHAHPAHGRHATREVPVLLRKRSAPEPEKV
jgi:hypothetical protein